MQKVVPLTKQRNKVVNYRKTQKYLFPNLSLAIIIPAYNEANSIGNTLQKIPRNISNHMDIIVIDDGSKDDTSIIAKKFDDVIVLNHLRNKGNGAAVKTGFDYCKMEKYDIVITLDADDQHNSADIPKLIKPILKKKVDFVVCNRFSYDYNMPIIRKIISKSMSALYSILFMKKITDPSNGFRAFSSRVIENLSVDSHYSTIQEILFKVMPLYRYCEVPSKVSERKKGTSFIRYGKYFKKTVEVFLKYYIIPRIKNPRLIYETFYLTLFNRK